MNRFIKPKQCIKGDITVAGDKSISHRAVMFGAIANGKTVIDGFLMGEDCLSTISCFRKLGIDINIYGEKVEVIGKGIRGLSKPSEILDVGNSGTTLRLIAGLLSAQNFSCSITGDSSIQKRPMDRVAVPLRLMGADITSQNYNSEKLFAPLIINGRKLKGIEYRLPVSSAQVKSAIILAGLYAESETVIIEPEPTRDHTEIMLNYFGADIKRNGDRIICQSVDELYAKNITVPGDISSAAYFLCAGAIIPDSDITLKNVGVNITRTGIIDVLKEMGANITLLNERKLNGEAVADINVKHSKLKGVEVSGAIIPRLIDEIPIIAVTACFAEGTTIIKDAAELKVKESDRIKTVTEELKKIGADITETPDGMIIKYSPLIGGNAESHNDHRIAMSLSVAGACSKEGVSISNPECADISFPDFYNILERL